MPYFEKLKMIKEEKGLTAAEIAKLGNVPLPTVTRVFNGNTQNATFETYVGIARGMGISLDELVGFKQPDEQPIASPIIETINSYSELLKEKDERILELKAEKEHERSERRRLTCAIIGFVAIVLIILALDILNGHFGYFQY